MKTPGQVSVKFNKLSKARGKFVFAERLGKPGQVCFQSLVLGIAGHEEHWKAGLLRPDRPG